jgi:hypothetical protein
MEIIIKYRAYYKPTNEMLYNVYPKPVLKNGEITKFLWFAVKEGKEFALEDDSSEIMRFTGRTDVNGIDIYEGDIIRDKYGMLFVVVLDDFENRFMGVTLCDEIWNERQGDVRFIREQSVEEYSLVVISTKFNNKEYLELLNEKLNEE